MRFFMPVFFLIGCNGFYLGSATNILNKSACLKPRVELPRPS
nr:MAG TPA: InvH outer membrane lipoprotein [Caudoviricetes sp.]